MQPNSEKQDFTKQNNNYSSEGVYPSHQGAPPPYTVYPQQPIGGAGYGTLGTPYITQTPLPQQNGVVLVPIRSQPFINRVLTPITPSLKIFLLLSGFIYAIWGVLAFSFQIAIVANSYSTYYNGFWTGVFLVFGGIIMMIIGCGKAYRLAQLIRMYVVDLIFCALALTFSITNYSSSNPCTSTSMWYCDDSLASNLKLAHIIIFGLALNHTIFNMIYISKKQTKALLTSNSNVCNY